MIIYLFVLKSILFKAPTGWLEGLIAADTWRCLSIWRVIGLQDILPSVIHNDAMGPNSPASFIRKGRAS